MLDQHQPETRDRLDPLGDVFVDAGEASPAAESSDPLEADAAGESVVDVDAERPVSGSLAEESDLSDEESTPAANGIARAVQECQSEGGESPLPVVTKESFPDENREFDFDPRLTLNFYHGEAARESRLPEDAMHRSFVATAAQLGLNAYKIVGHVAANNLKIMDACRKLYWCDERIDESKLE